MSQFRQRLKAERKRAGLTQQQLAAKAGIDHSYISKMETDDETLPTRDIALGLADALGISDKIDRIKFLAAAGVVNDEDMEGFELVEVEDGQAKEEEDQGSGAATYSAAHPAISIRSLPSTTTIGGQIERLIAAAGLSEEEEEELGADLIKITRWRVAFIEMQRKTRKKGSR